LGACRGNAGRREQVDISTTSTLSVRLSGDWSAAATADRLAIVALGIVTAIGLATFRDYGLGWDDYTHSQYGELLLELYRSGFSDQRALSFVNLYKYGGGFDMAAALVAKILPFDLFETRRLVGAAIGIVGLIATWRIGRRLGGPTAGLIGVLLLATCPIYYGHMFMNAKDAPFAAAMAVLLLGLVRAFEEYPQPDSRTVALTGIGVGLAFGSRILAGIAASYALAALLLIVTAEIRKVSIQRCLTRLGEFTWRLLPGLVLGYLIMGRRSIPFGRQNISTRSSKSPGENFLPAR
jgi:4-amino-4-deoxy-L-arabinose transferase-like glycosyltransferase